MASDLTIIIPAFNEAKSIADTVKSLKNQTVKVARIIVVDDFSSDGTGEIARAAGAEVLRPEANTGTKAGAQNFALKSVTTKFTMAIDADTILAPDAIERLLPALQDPKVAAACGFVLPRYVRTLWERGRYIEYLFAFVFFKQVQDYYECPLISSGCFSVYRSSVLQANGGWSTRTMAEDMDLTWSFYQAGHKVRFVTGALCYPIEPNNYTFMSKQLRRWSHGFIQNFKFHWRGVLRVPYLRSVVIIAMIDAVIASIFNILLLPALIIFVSPLFAIIYLADLPAVMVPVLFQAVSRKETGLAISSIPAYFVLRTFNGFMFLEALITEVVLRRTLATYEKGH